MATETTEEELETLNNALMEVYAHVETTLGALSLGQYPEVVVYTATAGASNGQNLVNFAQALVSKVKYTSGKSLVPSTRASFVEEAPDSIKEMMGNFGGDVVTTMTAEYMNDEVAPMVTAVQQALPIVVRWLITFRAPARYGGLFLNTFGISTSGIPNTCVLVAYDVRADAAGTHAD